MAKNKTAFEIHQSILKELSRPRTTYWSPLGYVNTYYLDTKKWKELDGVKPEINNQ